MARKKPMVVHPYIPNSVPKIKQEMLQEIGVTDTDELYQEMPDNLRLKRKLNLPEPLVAEYDLKRHMQSILMKNRTCEDNLSFLGGGCWQHYVPAVCDEIMGRSEVLTAYAGHNYGDFGRFQIFFEYQSQLGELLGMDVVCLPVYSWGTAAAYAIRMASRITGRKQILVPKTVGPERLTVMKTFCPPEAMSSHIALELVAYDTKTGLLDLEDLRGKISAKTAAIYFENPLYLGTIESQGKEISSIAHDKGAISIVGVDPLSLGVLAPPASYGADIAVGTIQPLGIHMNCGGGMAGFIASRNEARYVAEYPSIMLSIAETVEKEEYGFGWCGWDLRTSFGIRDDKGLVRKESKDFTGTTSCLWAIGAAVYMALMGPQGFKELGQTIIERAHYAAKLIAELKGVKILFSPNYFKEFVVNFDGTGKSVEAINRALLKHNIFGGNDISKTFPELGQSALYCVTEIHSKNDIEKLAGAIKEVIWK